VWVVFRIASSGRALAQKAWLNLLSVHPVRSTLYRFQSGQRSARSPIFKTGHPKAQGSTRSPLRSKRFMRCGKSRVNVAGSPPLNFRPDKRLLRAQALGAARGIGLCRSATRAPGRPWIADASGPVAKRFGAGLFPEGYLCKPRPMRKTHRYSDLISSAYLVRSGGLIATGFSASWPPWVWARGRGAQATRSPAARSREPGSISSPGRRLGSARCAHATSPR
jgi:hypothetical protein